MGDVKQAIENIAQQVPGYPGYQSKDRRRDADKVLRERLANQYDALRERLDRMAGDAVRRKDMNAVEELERSSQQLQRFITRLRIAPRGYAGWFDAAQIEEADLDQLYQFDSSLAAGVEQLKSAVDGLANTSANGSQSESASGALADLIAELNGRLDAREEFLALGKRPAPTASPLGALKAPAKASAQESAFEQLKQGDAVSFEGTDYLIAGRITYSVSSGKFNAYLLQNQDPRHWLRAGPNQELAMLEEIEFTLPSPLPQTLNFAGKNYSRAEEGVANVTVEGASGVKTGSVNYTRYAADAGGRLWVEDWGNELKAQVGQVVDPMELKLYRKL